MLFDLQGHGIGRKYAFRPGRRALGGNAFEDITSAIVSRVSQDPNIKADTTAKAVEMATGIRPKVERVQGVTWVRLLPQHGEFIDAVFVKGVNKITSGPSKGQAADFKIDVFPALSPFLWRRVFPTLVLAFIGAAGVGYFVGRK